MKLENVGFEDNTSYMLWMIAERLERIVELPEKMSYIQVFAKKIDK